MTDFYDVEATATDLLDALTVGEIEGACIGTVAEDALRSAYIAGVNRHTRAGQPGRPESSDMDEQYECFTNLDDFQLTRWPRRFVFPPRVGDWIEGRGSRKPDVTRPRLCVVSITHTADDRGAPLVRIELHRGA